VTLGAPARDAFGRALAYVWTDDGKLANQELLAHGEARVLIVSPNDRYEQSLRLAQARAAGARRGLWATC
jgi:micrococcal nuclease